MSGLIFLLMRIHQSIYIEQAGTKGNGVFTDTDLPADTVIEVSPVLVMKEEEREMLDQTLLHDYIFLWEPAGEPRQCCMAQGYISVYNHSSESNCEHFMDYENNAIIIKTMQNISAGSELTINYNGDWDNDKPVWFDTV